jgi:hypothetical protein
LIVVMSPTVIADELGRRVQIAAPGCAVDDRVLARGSAVNVVPKGARRA